MLNIIILGFSHQPLNIIIFINDIQSLKQKLITRKNLHLWLATHHRITNRQLTQLIKAAYCLQPDHLKYWSAQSKIFAEFHLIQ
ncbi:hypothetical protein DC094_08165 [Pelagibaculum spongiae]|uniref:Uncharacterized protein n=1 Tax=Pelagibaculum spongiae TaxID=2080658 RepID=A0A2V1H4I2_9GAMM|nr:hypothetical protein DC094_08165 [Pelagibaculum spongiae]